MDKEQFSALIEKSYKELVEKQDNLIKNYKIDEFEEYYYDQEKKILEFINDKKTMLKFDMIIIGTWASQQNNWMWAWANTSMTDEIRKDSERLKKLFEITEVDLFNNPMFPCDEEMSYDIAAISIYHLGALGLYRTLSNMTYIYIAIIKKID